jgi:hypothetical protein
MRERVHVAPASYAGADCFFDDVAVSDLTNRRVIATWLRTRPAPIVQDEDAWRVRLLERD